MPATIATASGPLAREAWAGQAAAGAAGPAAAGSVEIVRCGKPPRSVIVVMRYPPLSSGVSGCQAPPGSHRR